MSNNLRNSEIDGIRGWASFFVVIFHFFAEVFGRLYPVFHCKLFGFFFYGHFMVLVFFILSGDALSVSFFKKNSSEATVRLVIVRYFRLTFPIIVTTLAIFLFMKMGYVYNITAANIVNRNDWLGQFINFEPKFTKFLHFIFGGVYLPQIDENNYNPFLWTMPIEMFGSLLIFLNIFILKQVRNKWKLLTSELIFFMIFEPYYCLFIAGMLMGGLRNDGYFDKIKDRKNSWVYLVSFIVIIIFISVARESTYTFGSYQLSEVINNFDAEWAIILVFLIYANKTLIALFNNRISQFLGEISFPLYVVQFMVLVTVFSYLIIFLNRQNSLHFSTACGIALFSTVLSIILSIPLRFLEKKFLIKINALINKKVINIK